MTNSIITILSQLKSDINLLSSCLGFFGLKNANSETTIQSETINRLIIQEQKHPSVVFGQLPIIWMKSEAGQHAKARINAFIKNIKNLSCPLILGDDYLFRFLPLWKEAFRDAGIVSRDVIIVRHPLDIEQSIIFEKKLDIDKALLIWLTYIRDSWRNCQRPVIVAYDQLIADPVSTLRDLGQELEIKYPREPQSNVRSLIDLIQACPQKKITDKLIGHEKNSYMPYEILYEEICSGKWRSADLPGGADLIDNLLKQIQHYKTLVDHCNTGEKKGRDNSNASLFAQFKFPWSKEGDNARDTITLKVDEWQHINLHMPNTAELRERAIKFKPININGTVKISAVKIVKLDNDAVIWEAKTPSDFDVFGLSGTVIRLPDLDKLLLIVTGDNAWLDFPVLKDIPDGPVRIELWVKASLDQQVLVDRFGKRPKPQRQGSSKLIWLASYPRSGNTLLRTVLHRNFGFKSYSIYNDYNDIGKYIEISDTVGHQFMHWPLFFGEHSAHTLSAVKYSKLDPLRYKTSDLNFVKTHSAYHDGFEPDKVIYVYRDGRAAMRSFASYKESFFQNSGMPNDHLDSLLCEADPLFGPWCDHLLSWKTHPRERILFLKFEDFIADFNSVFKQISEFLDIEPIRTDVLPFEHLHAINPHFFRKGKENSWRDLFDETRHALFWILNYEAMAAFGFDSDRHPICKLLDSTAGKNIKDPQPAGRFDDCLKDHDQTLQACARFIKERLQNQKDEDRKILSRQLKKRYQQFSDYFNSNTSSNDNYQWDMEWKILLDGVAR